MTADEWRREGYRVVRRGALAYLIQPRDKYFWPLAAQQGLFEKEADPDLWPCALRATLAHDVPEQDELLRILRVCACIGDIACLWCEGELPVPTHEKLASRGL